jgi:hypothetical protein
MIIVGWSKKSVIYTWDLQMEYVDVLYLFELIINGKKTTSLKH